MNYLIAFIIAAVAVGCVLIVKGGNRFDMQIRQEIDEEIEKLKKEIEML